MKRYNIPQGPLLSKLQRTGKLEYNGQTLQLTDLFDIHRLTLGYSGDTALDLELLKWFDDIHLLLHESTYLDRDPSYHNDYHTSIPDLVEKLLEINLSSLKMIIPVHISQRYKWEDIEEKFNEYREKYSQWIWYAPKTGDIVEITALDKEPTILSLPYTYRM